MICRDKLGKKGFSLSFTENIFYYISVYCHAHPLPNPFSRGALRVLPCSLLGAEGWVWIRESRESEHSHLLQASLPDPAWPHPVPWSAPLSLPEGCRQPTHLLLRVVKSAHQNWHRNLCFLLAAGAYPVTYGSVDSIPLSFKTTQALKQKENHVCQLICLLLST